MSSRGIHASSHITPWSVLNLCCAVLCAMQVIGGGLRDSFLVAGVAFKKTFSYAGFEQQPKAFDSE
jgi:hypothetical protein